MYILLSVCMLYLASGVTFHTADSLNTDVDGWISVNHLPCSPGDVAVLNRYS